MSSVPASTAIRLIQSEIATAERTLALGDHLFPWLLVTADLSSYAVRLPGGGLKLETVTAALPGAYRWSEVPMRAAADRWNASLSPDQVEACTVEAVHESTVLRHLIASAGAMLGQLQTA